MKTKEFTTFVGLVPNFQEESLCVAIIDTYRRSLFTDKFYFKKSSIKDVSYYGQKQDFESDFTSLSKFLKEKIINPNNTRFLVEIPSALLDEDSLNIFKLLIFLFKSKYCLFEYRLVGDKIHNVFVQLAFPYIISRLNNKEPQISFIPEQYMLNSPSEDGVLYIQQGVSEAYANFLLDGSSSSTAIAVCAALIARNVNLHRFFNSMGLVQSSHDLFMYMQMPQKEPTSVISGGEVFTTAKLPVTTYIDLEKIPLKYAIARNKNAFLGDNNAIKFALLYVCKLWKIHLSCMPIDASVEAIQLGIDENDFCFKYFMIFDPNNIIDQWIYTFLE